jgi:hypothetical protein
MLHWYMRSWWIIAPPTILLAVLQVWAHTGQRYVTGKPAQDFGIPLGHGELPLLLWLALPLLAAALWLLIGIVLTLFRRLPIATLAWKAAALVIALALISVPRQTWDEVLVRTIGPGEIAGELLGAAAQHGDTDTIRKLLEMGTPVDVRNNTSPSKVTALQVAVLNKQTEAAKLLLERGADPNRTAYEASPLMWAVDASNVPLVRLLLQHGANACASGVRYNRSVRTVVTIASVAKQRAHPDILALIPDCPGNQ